MGRGIPHAQEAPEPLSDPLEEGVGLSGICVEREWERTQIEEQDSAEEVHEKKAPGEREHTESISRKRRMKTGSVDEIVVALMLDKTDEVLENHGDRKILLQSISPLFIPTVMNKGLILIQNDPLNEGHSRFVRLPCI